MGTRKFPINGLYRVVRKWYPFFGLQVNKRKEISPVKVYETAGKSSVLFQREHKMNKKKLNSCFFWLCLWLSSMFSSKTIYYLHSNSSGKGWSVIEYVFDRSTFFDIKGLRKGYLFCSNGVRKDKGLDLVAGPPRVKLCWVPRGKEADKYCKLNRTDQIILSGFTC